MNHIRKTAISALAGIALLGALPAAAFASRHHSLQTHATQAAPRLSGFAFGSLGGVTDAGATVVQPQSGSVSLTFSSKSRFIARSVAAARGGLNNGAQMIVYGTPKGNTVLVQTLEYDISPFVARGVRISGGFASATGNSLTLSTKSGPMTVKTVSNTHYTVNGKRTTAVGHLTLSQGVVVIAQELTDGTYVARHILVNAH